MGAIAWQPLAAQLGELTTHDIPAATAEHAVRVIADTVGVIAAGARQPEIQRLVAGDDPLFPTMRRDGGAQLFTEAHERVEPITAAFVNATAGTFLELDEGVRPTGHPGVHVIPAALAAAQALHRSGEQLLTAVVAGYELAARLFEAYELRHPTHPHGHFGAMGAALAVARLREVDPVPAVEVAATFPLLAVWEPCFEGATTRNAYAGFAAANGVAAHRLLEAGFIGSKGATNAAFDRLVGTQVNPGALTTAVSPSELRIARNYFKFHSACVLTHAAVDAVQALGPHDPDSVESVTVATTWGGMRIARQARPNPLSARFSLPYTVAAAIAHGEVTPATMEYGEAVASLAMRVAIEVDNELDGAWPDAAPARVHVRSFSGVESVATVMNHHGHHRNPASLAKLRAKFERLWGTGSDATYDHLLALRGLPDCTELL